MRAFYLFAALCFLYVVPVTMLYNRAEPVWTVLFFLFWMAALLFFWRFYENPRVQRFFEDTKRRRLFLFCLLAVYGAVFFYFGWSVLIDYSKEEWDMWALRTAAQYVAEHYKPERVLNIEYFQRYTNNEFVLAWLSGWYALCRLLPWQVNYDVAGLALNTISIVVAAAFTYLAACAFFTRRQAVFTLLVWPLFLPFYGFAGIYYTDIPGLPFITGAMLLLSRFYKTGFLRWAAAAGLVVGLGGKMKGTLFIFAVAVAIWLVFQNGLSALKRCLALALAAACFLGAVKGFGLFYEKSGFFGREPRNIGGMATPFTHWIMMAQSAYGPWDINDVNFTFTIKMGYKERMKVCFDIAVGRVLSRDLLTNLLFTNKKVLAVWGDGTYEASVGTPDNAYRPDSFGFKAVHPGTPYYPWFERVCNGFHFSLMTLFLLTLWRRVREKSVSADPLMLLQLSLLGMFLFELIWEWQSRYLLGYVPMLLCVAPLGLPLLEQGLARARARLPALRPFRQKDG